MATLAQWTVNAAYTELGKIDRAGRDALAGLEEQKTRLQHAYTTARNQGDQLLMGKLQPLIHRNSSLRLQARDYVAKFNATVKAISGYLTRAGLSVPATLSGLGVVAPALIIIPATIIAGMLILWGIINSMNAKTAAINHDLDALLQVAMDPTKTPAERAAAWKAWEKRQKESAAAGSPGDWFKQLTPILGLVLAVVVAPTLLKLVPTRRRGARA